MLYVVLQELSTSTPQALVWWGVPLKAVPIQGTQRGVWSPRWGVPVQLVPLQSPRGGVWSPHKFLQVDFCLWQGNAFLLLRELARHLEGRVSLTLEEIFISLSLFLFLSVKLCQLHYTAGTPSWGRIL